MYNKHIKPILDILFAIVFSIGLFPLFLIIAIILKFSQHGSILYKQERVGQNGEIFLIYKFRSMSVDAPILFGPERFKIKSKITRVGKFLRVTSLDEIPQLINILRGEMSFIGPRPVIYAEKKLLALRQREGALDIKPGITGLAQVHGRKKLTIAQKAQYDAMYADNISLWLDFCILVKTIPVISEREGVRKSFKKH
ncbi:sugar transferase [Leuconostoc pseudomesenteroides]|uniref:sugar transferase n=1 Tax=Leuconostoc pseudomesenteroides TaxID=33968 RepID=UPI0039E8F998